MATHSLLPSLSALLPADTHPLFLARISLQAIHIEHYHVRQDVYTAPPNLPNTQPRSLRICSKRRRPQRRLDRARARAGGNDNHDNDNDNDNDINDENEYNDYDYEYSVQYLSPPLSGREYADMSVRASLALDVLGCRTRKEIEGFVRGLGFSHSHSFTRQGHLIHLPTPAGTTLHLSITRVSPIPSQLPSLASSTARPSLLSTGAAAAAAAAAATPTKTTPDLSSSSEPYLVQLEPSRAVMPVGTMAAQAQAQGKGATVGTSAMAPPVKEMDLQETMALLHQVAGRIEGVRWETGR